ncbi:glycosyltransferase family 87 protein [Tabrizicola sp.]|uniref:glycosyltransferase family 87 protein n=1 Tax=Tabrizicola sp. TaxID=2005166 RepID=UPI0027375E5C|nr:glycosyltransferase family 87 protein [Tabrizicola sp.]MDP3198062.1 glycosyltransferase family 87 protein [Tabrizicola sp.]
MEAWLIDKDFANYWTAARLVLNGQVLDLFADHATYFRHLTDQFGPDTHWRNWSYPPHYLLVIWPLGFFGYFPAMAGFLGLTLVAYLWALRAFVGPIIISLALATAMVLPSIFDNLYHAQNGFLSAALLLGGLAFRMERPVLAGVLIGCLTIKPQLGVLLPLLLLIERRWLVIASASLTAAGLVILSGVLFGWESWSGYLTQTLPYQSRVMTDFFGIFLGMMPTIFGALRVLEVDPQVALTVHAAVAVPVIGVAGWALRQCRDADLRAALAIMTTLVAVPYWLTYDYGIAAAALLLTCDRAKGTEGAPWRRCSLLVLAAFMPTVAIPLWLFNAPLTPGLVLLGFALVLQAAVQATRQLDRD